MPSLAASSAVGPGNEGGTRRCAAPKVPRKEHVSGERGSVLIEGVVERLDHTDVFEYDFFAGRLARGLSDRV